MYIQKPNINHIKAKLEEFVRIYFLQRLLMKTNNKTYYERNFKTIAVNQIRSTDISEFHITVGKLYLSPIIDVHNREIISYSISTSPNFLQVMDMLGIAFKNIRI